jgi:RNA polymerase sigma-70 factor (ECF subfamily)
VRNLDYPEKELVRRSKDGDMEAFEVLIASYEKRIFNIAFRMTGNREDAFDVAQEVCIKIYRAISSFRENSSFSTWVYRITSNVCIDEIRKRNNVVSLTVTTDRDEEYEIPVLDQGKLPDEIVESRETVEDVRKCICELAPGHRMIIILKDIHGYSY